jgi:beta-lactamase regulating signal transducer with metallopeptidase domain
MNYGAWLLATWLAFALLSLAPFAAGVVAVARMRRRAQAFSEGDLQALASALGRCIGLKHPTRLLRGPAGSMPMATGFIKPADFLPDDALAWTEKKRRVVLLHELAHVKRRDCLTHAIARTATALHWFNPLAWLALRQLRIEREHACDDLVLAAGERPSAYAENLLEIARTLRADTITAAAAITMAHKSQLEGRLLAVLDGARNRSRVTKRLVAASILGTILVLALVSSVEVARSEGDEVIGVNSDDVDNAVSTPQPERPDGDLSVEFPGGYRVRLAGVGESNGKPSETFWAADGSPLTVAPKGFQDERGFVTPSEEEIGRAFFLELHPPVGGTLSDVAFTCQPEFPGSTTSQSGTRSESSAQSTFKTTLPSDLTETSIQVGIATGPWKTAIKSCLGCGTGTSNEDGEHNVIFSDAFVRNGENRVIATHSVYKQEYRVVAIDATGFSHPLVSAGSGGSGEMIQSEWILQTIEPEDVKGLEIQIRDYEWRTIDGIALHPNTELAGTPPREKPMDSSEATTVSDLIEKTLPRLKDPLDTDMDWGEENRGLQAALRFLPEKVAYALGETVGVEVLVRNSSPKTIEFATSKWRQDDQWTVLDATDKKLEPEQKQYSAPRGFLRVRLDPGQSVTLKCASVALFPIGDSTNIEYPVATRFTTEVGIHSVQLDLNLPGGYSDKGPGVPKPDDWTGTLTTGKRILNLVEQPTPDAVADGPDAVNLFKDPRQALESSNPQPVVPAFLDPFAPNPRDKFLRTPGANAVWGEVKNGLQSALQFTQEEPVFELGKAIPFEFLVRNVSDAPVQLVIREHLQYGAPKVFDGSGNSLLAGSISNTAWPSLVRIQLDPGQCVGLPGEGLAFLPKGVNAASNLDYYVGTYVETQAGTHSVQFTFALPGETMPDGVGTPQSGDWTGTLTTGKRHLKIVESEVPIEEAPAQVTEVQSTTESAVRAILAEMQDDEEGYLVTVSASQRERLRALLPDAADFLLALASDDREEARADRRKAASILSQFGTEIPREKLEKFFATAGRTYVRSRPVYPQGVAASIATGYNFSECVGLWERGDGLVLKTTTQCTVDGRLVGEPFEYTGAGGGSRWIETKSLSPGTHTAQVSTDYEITHHGLTFAGTLHSEPVMIEIGAPSLADELAAPASQELEQEVRHALKISSFENMSFDGDSPSGDQPNVIFLGPVGAGTRLHLPNWKLTEALPVDLCFDVSFQVEESGEIFAGYPLIVLKNTIGEAYLSPLDLRAFAAGRTDAVPVRILLTPSRALALTDLNVTQYYNGTTITSDVVEAFVDPPTETVDSNDLTLGHEVEVTVRHSGENSMIDIDTGKLFTPPEFKGTEEVLHGPRRMASTWVAQSKMTGAD